MTTPLPWTRAELARLPDDSNRYEVLDGTLLVTAPPLWPHVDIASELMGQLHTFCRMQQIGVVVAPAAIIWDDNELIPDIAVFAVTRTEAMEKDWTELPLPVLVVEVECDSSRHRDRVLKRGAYLERLGIPEYWSVDPDSETIRVFSGRDQRQELSAADTLRWSPNAAAVAFEVALRDLFLS